MTMTMVRVVRRVSVVALAAGFVVLLTMVGGCKLFRKRPPPLVLPTMPQPQALSGSPWEVCLPNGAVVELVGFAPSPSGGEEWWAPDGQPLAERPYDRPQSDPFGGRTWDNRKAIEMAFRTFMLADGLQGPATSVSMSENMGMGSVIPLDSNGESDWGIGIRAEGILFRADLETVDITIGTAAGEWTTIGRGTIGEDGVIRDFALDDGHGYLRLAIPRRDAPESTTVSAIMDFSLESAFSWRFVVVDKTGVVRPLEECGMDNVTEEGQPTRRLYDFGLSRSVRLRQDTASWWDQVEIRFEIRRFHYATFQNVSLVPGKPTDVRIITGVKGE